MFKEGQQSERVSGRSSKRRWKRRCVGLRKCNADESVRETLDDPATGIKRAEEDYCSFANASGASADTPREDDDRDPQYEMFLAHLKPDGNSYVLRVSKGDDTPVLVRYHEDETTHLKMFLERTEPDSCRPNEATDLSVCPKSGLEDSELSYGIFLKHTKFAGYDMIFKDGDGEKVIYEEPCEAGSSSDSEILGTESVPHCSEGGFMPFVANLSDSVMDVDEDCCIKNLSTRSSSAFRVNLMSILEEPYDHMEYKDLWEQISQRKPSKQSRVLRSRTTLYPVNRHSKSYLDQHWKLAEKIESFRHDRGKVLNILRGFFYWLKNLAHEGAFYPWLDESCLAVVPRTK